MNSQKQPRITGPTLKVLGVLLSAKNAEISGAEIARVTNLASGTIYPLLFRLQEAKWLSSRWEEQDPQAIGRPRRKLYALTGVGEREAKAAVHELRSVMGVLAWR